MAFRPFIETFPHMLDFSGNETVGSPRESYSVISRFTFYLIPSTCLRGCEDAQRSVSTEMGQLREAGQLQVRPPVHFLGSDPHFQNLLRCMNFPH